MKRVVKILCLALLLCSVFSVGLPIAYAEYNSKYLTETAPSDYYASLDTSLTGESFRRNLSSIISKNYKQHSYKTNDQVLKQTDPDPNRNGNIICFYTGQSLSGGWNKEHVWAKSHGFGTASWAPYCDAHHLRPTLISINSSRSNSDFGDLSGVSGVKSDAYGNRWTSDTFEPRDEVKGDVARIMFYMATRYGFESPYNLKLVNDPHTSVSKTGNGRFGNLQTLLKWHYEDPVSSSEIYRNNVIFDDWQRNRNPYIDHPEYVDLAWPNSYSNNQEEINQAKVDNVITLIASLPQVITLNDKDTVLAAKAAYDALSLKEKDRVTNYQQLTAAIETIKRLENGSIIDEPIHTTEKITCDFTGLNGLTYIQNKTIDVDGKSFFASALGIYSNEFRLGLNSNLPAIDSKYGVSGNGAVLEQLFDVENAASLTITLASKNYGELHQWYVLFKETGSSSYQVVASKEEDFPKQIHVDLSAPKNGRFVLIVTGSSTRAVITKYEIGVANSSNIDLNTLAVQTSILATVQNDKLISAGIRFGGRFNSALFEGATSFGVIVYDTSLEEQTLEDWYEGGSITDFIVEISELIPCKMMNFIDDRAIVDENGNLNSNGGYYQFGCVINDIVGHEKVEFRAVIYLEKDGIVYFSDEIETSFYDELVILQNDDSLTENEQVLVHLLIEQYR